MSNSYKDKEFIEIYHEIVEKVKNLTTKWDPSVSDESDPGVVILKSFALFVDKLLYKINYRDAQRSVERVTDLEEGKKLFSELGYRVKGKRSATGQLSIRYLNPNENSSAEIGLFTQFSNSTGSQRYTSVRNQVTINGNQSKLVEVQEGVPTKYEFEGKNVFNTEDLSTSLRISLHGIEDLAENGIVICSQENLDSPIVSDWLNIDDNPFITVETDNIFSIGQDIEGKYYLQFYEKSLPSLKKGIGIWVISSSGSAGNVSSNTINRLVTSIGDIGQSDLYFTHGEFLNGSDGESLSEAKVNYYDSFGVNNTLISERDYETVLLKTVGPDLKRLASKILVTGVDGPQNLVEILSSVPSGQSSTLTILTKFISEALLSAIYFCALRNTTDYYGSFEQIEGNNNEVDLFRKAIYKNSAVSQFLELVSYDGGGEGDGSLDDNYLIRYLYDFVKLGGVVVVNSNESENTIVDRIISSIAKTFNSANLVEGEMIAEERLSSVIEQQPGVISASFYYGDTGSNGHEIFKYLNSSNVENRDSLNLGKTGIAGNFSLNFGDKVDLLARSILKGDLSLFSRNQLQAPPGYTLYGENSNQTIENKRLISISSSRSQSEASDLRLGKNENLQLLKIAKKDIQLYGMGVSYVLFSSPVVTKADIKLDKNLVSTLKAGSILTEGSTLFSVDEKVKDKLTAGNFESIESEGYLNITITSDCKVIADLTLQNYEHVIKEGSTIYDGSELYYSYEGQIEPIREENKSDNKIYGLVLKSDRDYNLEALGGSLWLQTDSDNTLEGMKELKEVRLSGFTMTSSGEATANNKETIKSYLEKVYVTSGKQISEIGDQVLSLSDDNYYYGIISKTPHTYKDDEGKVHRGLKLSDMGDDYYGYILSGDEHLIYSDQLKVDFIDYGSGTLVRVPVKSIGNFTKVDNNSILLENLIDYENLSASLTKAPQGLEVCNTEILNFFEGTVLNGPIPGNSWSKLGELKINGEAYGSDYYVRLGLVLSTIYGNIVEVPQGIKINVSVQGDNSVENFVFSNNTDSNLLISVSEPLFLNTFDGLTFEEGPNITVFSPSSISDADVSIDEGSFTLTKTLNAGNELNIPVEKNSLIKVKVNKNVNLSVSNTSLGFEILNGSGTSLTGEHWIYFYRKNNEKGNLVLTAGADETNVEILDFITLSDSKRGFNPDAVLDTNSVGIVFNRVEELLGSGKPFEYQYFPESPLDPLDPISFYDPRHLLNRNILPVIDLNYLRNNLRIIRRSNKR